MASTLTHMGDVAETGVLPLRRVNLAAAVRTVRPVARGAQMPGPSGAPSGRGGRPRRTGVAGAHGRRRRYVGPADPARTVARDGRRAARVRRTHRTDGRRAHDA